MLINLNFHLGATAVVPFAKKYLGALYAAPAQLTNCK